MSGFARFCFATLFCLLGHCAWAQTDPPQETEQQPAAKTETDLSQEDADLQRPIPDYEPDETPAPPPPLKLERGNLYGRLLGNMMVVLGLIVLLAWLARKYLPGRLKGLAQGQHVRLIQNLPLGPKRAVSLVAIGDRRLLLGVTDHQVTLIKDLDEFGFAATLEEAKPKTVTELQEEIS